MKLNELLTEIKDDTLDLPDLEVGDTLMVGKFKNRKAEIKGFKKDKHNQPIAKTNKGDQQIFKGRVKKLMPDEINEDVFRSSSPCVPLAILRVSGKEEDEVQNVCVINKWSKKRGMTPINTISAIQQLGLNYKERFDLHYYKKQSTDPLLKDQPGYQEKYPRTLNMLLKVIPDGKFIINVNRHAVAIIDGVLYDDAHVGRKHKIQSVYEILEN